MKSEKNILFAFILNLSFSFFEFFGGIFTGSIAIASDAIHDIGDAISIGFSYFFEKKSKRQPDEIYTFGYARYSVLGGLITSSILLVGSVLIIYKAIYRIIFPSKINYNGMIVFAVVGTVINLLGAFFTRDKDSLNQRAINLHLLEDVLGWVTVLIGAIAIRFTNLTILDPILSIGVAIFILVNASKNLKEILNILLEKAPQDINPQIIKNHVSQISGVLGVHHIHIWNLDGQKNFATLHVVVSENAYAIKLSLKNQLKKLGIAHSTIELETQDERCYEEYCHIEHNSNAYHHH